MMKTLRSDFTLEFKKEVVRLVRGGQRQSEVSRLKAELARTRMERDILKKATAYFARESR